MSTKTRKEYLEMCNPWSPIPEGIMNCGELLDLINENDDLRDQLTDNKFLVIELFLAWIAVCLSVLCVGTLLYYVR